MSLYEFLVSDALVASDFAPELLRDLALPALSTLAAHASERPGLERLPEPPLLPLWQHWVMRRDARPSLPAVVAERLGVSAAGRPLWMAQPVHFALGIDHVVLSDPADLNLAQQEADELAASVAEPLGVMGFELHAAQPEVWFLTRTEPLALSAPAAELAIGQNVALWMPTGEEGGARAWRRTLNDIQMLWHEHPVNTARGARGLPPVNALWLTGTGASTYAPLPYRTIHGTVDWFADAVLEGALEGVRDGARAGEGERDRSDDLPTLELFTHLSAPARASDWNGWRTALRALDVRLGELLAQLRSGSIEALDLVLSGPDRLRIVRIRRSDLWKFWRRGTAAELLATDEAAA